jgi:hypothetical protein
MKIRESILDSAAEASGFRSLKTRWSSKLSLYPQLPLTKIIQIDQGELGRGRCGYIEPRQWTIRSASQRGTRS